MGALMVLVMGCNTSTMVTMVLVGSAARARAIWPVESRGAPWVESWFALWAQR